MTTITESVSRAAASLCRPNLAADRRAPAAQYGCVGGFLLDPDQSDADTHISRVGVNALAADHSSVETHRHHVDGNPLDPGHPLSDLHAPLAGVHPLPDDQAACEAHFWGVVGNPLDPGRPTSETQSTLAGATLPADHEEVDAPAVHVGGKPNSARSYS